MTDPDLDLLSLVLFLAVVELGSVSKAAARHGISQPSATTRLAKLETKLGVTLLERRASGSEATAVGRTVAMWAAEVVAAANTMIDGATSLSVARSSSLRIAATPLIAGSYLSGWVAAAGLSGVDVSVLEANTRRVATMVRDGEVDVGFLAGPYSPIGIRSEIVTIEPLVVVVAPGHPWAKRKKPIDMAELATSRLVLRTRGSGTFDVIEAALSADGFDAAAGHVTVASDAAARIGVISGAGVGIAPLLSTRDDLNAGNLVQVSIEPFVIEQPIRVAWRTSKPSNAALDLIETVRSLDQ